MTKRVFFALFAVGCALAIGAPSCGGDNNGNGDGGNDGTVGDVDNGDGGCWSNCGDGGSCTNLGVKCAANSECCTGNCSNGTCQPGSCTSDNQACSSNGAC